MAGPPARLVLASRSPQRRAILETLGVPFRVRPADIPERTRGEPREVAGENALRKARAVAAGETGGLVLGVDTLVALGREIYGKPVDAAAAGMTLRALSGARHTVWSGLALLEAGGGDGVGEGAEPRLAVVATAVRFRPLDEASIAWYVAGGEWRGRAGGYAIQGRGAALVEAIDGDYTNVVGLPVAALLRLWPQMLGGAV
ncbi:MAG: nucleoside triphosphate pyrophosphatase [Solirubrobacteraceae bacterium]|nr:nucleoside triphosphate pyrophosphatase [Solirubrobacteraceae bacterium]